MMQVIETPESQRKLSEALRQMLAALDLLDELGAPSAIGISLDLAVARLEEFLGRKAVGKSSVQDLFEQVERELASAQTDESERPAPWELSPS